MISTMMGWFFDWLAAYAAVSLVSVTCILLCVGILVWYRDGVP